jgi:Flp pilus assembly protein TadD
MALRNTTRQTILLTVIILLCVGNAAAQIAGGLTETTNTRLGGNNYIAGIVFAPNGEPIKSRMRIRLSSPAWGDILATTDDTGRFVFSGVGSGVYTVSIEGEKDFEPVMQQVDIVRRRSPVPETYTMTIRLRFSEKAKSKGSSVISASNAGVPKRALALYEKATKLVEANDYAGAIEKLKLAVAEYPNFVNAFNEIGVIYLRLNKLEMADEALQAALRIKPDAYEPLINRGIALFRLGRWKDAESALRDALKVKPESAVVYYYLGRTLNNLDRIDEAEAAYLSCSKLSPDKFKEVHRLLAVIYLDRGNLEGVIRELETYLRLAPTAVDAEHLRTVIAESKRLLPQRQPDRP